MPGPIDLLYTTIGGVIGAGLTQYVTHLRDRRSARALVIERVAEIEDAFEALRWASPEDEHPLGTSQIARMLGALEAAALVAGAPQSILRCYTASVKHYEDVHRISRTATFIGKRIAQSVNDNVTELRESPRKDEIVATLMRLSAGIKTLQERAESIDEPTFRIHDSALLLLRTALWHPLVLQLRRRTLYRLQRSTDQLERTSRELTGTLRSAETAYKEAFRVNFKLKLADNTTSDDANADTEQK